MAATIHSAVLAQHQPPLANAGMGYRTAERAHRDRQLLTPAPPVTASIVLPESVSDERG
jgi:hypothetical protein